MLKKTIITTSILALLSTTAMANEPHNKRGHQQNMERGHHKGQHGHHSSQRGNSNRGDLLNSIEQDVALTVTQKEGLNYIIEEEKVARDVYITLAKNSSSRIFLNISKSEQKHMNAVKNLFQNYDVELPLTLDTIGEFENEELQALYRELVEKGSASREAALEVGVEIEEMDIADLESLMDSEIPSDFKRVYSNLLRGSYKHLSAFNRQLNK